MRKKQTGISLLGLIFGSMVVIIAALLAMKTAPSYIEYFNAKKAIFGIANENPEASVKDVRNSFESRATIDDITSIRSQDLEISKDRGLLVIAFNYRKEIKLFSNISLCIDFAANTQEP